MFYNALAVSLAQRLPVSRGNDQWTDSSDRKRTPTAHGPEGAAHRIRNLEQPARRIAHSTFTRRFTILWINITQVKRFWMGHTQCVSQTRESDTQTRTTEDRRQIPDSFRTAPKPAGVPVHAGRMILPNLIPEKSLIPVRLKDPGLEPRQRESTKDALGVQSAMAQLAESGWYWGCITAAQAKQVLNEALEGTFLLRDSSNPGYLLTLSVKTSLGPTHLRIAYSDGAFGFDSVAVARPRLRQFEGAVELVQHYALAYQRSLGLQHQPKPPEEEVPPGTPESTLQLKLTRPLYKSAPSLQHLCRITINQRSRSHRDLPLPDRLKGFLLEYPFLL
ncbi:hypothetical protein AAFF_G00214290 [Aldrovandia affinis]|uniref:Suppressor of cytokine signaling 2 n=1 Tax=Aldrovandia affinis TaxID=143900 RepID=A0AAD7RGN1_9TELE|nr:hypothetical protein AAFF_G00214290 [Aldrovandia affinis]